MNRTLPIIPATLAVVAASLPTDASDVDLCAADQYEPCSFFTTNREIGHHEQIIDNHLAGFTRSEGSWTISVRYQPDTQCAKVDILVDMGPLDIPRQYREEFSAGAGEISDSGAFMHKMDDLESALGILSSSCRVPRAESSQADTAAGDGATPDEEERERLALEEERERLALERERERLAVEREQERLALERERLALEHDLAAARERERLERERAHRLEEERRERERLAQRQREQEELARRQAQHDDWMHDEWTREDTADASETDPFGDVMTGLGLGVLAGAIIAGDDEALDAAADILTGSLGGVYAPSTGSTYDTGSGTCQELGERFATDYGAFHGDGSMCGIYRHQYNVMVAYREPLVRNNCTDAAEWDASIRQTREGVEAACAGS